MALLTETQRLQIWRGLMRYWSNLREQTGAFTKFELKDAVDATDTWIENNSASYNSALPEPFRSEGTSAQKALMFAAVALMKYAEDLLRSLFGDID